MNSICIGRACKIAIISYTLYKHFHCHILSVLQANQLKSVKSIHKILGKNVQDEKISNNKKNIIAWLHRISNDAQIKTMKHKSENATKRPKWNNNIN